jgi:hypothetical protein
MLGASDGFRCGLRVMALRSFQSMKSKLLIVADLGLVKAYKLDFTLNRTPRLEQLEEVVLEEAHGRVRLLRDLTKVRQKELLDQSLDVDGFVI